MEALMNILTQAFDATSSLVQGHPQIATVVTVGSVLAAMWTNHKNRQATIFGHSLQAITHLDQRWEALEMRNDRRLAAQYLLDQNQLECNPQGLATRECEHLDAVLNFLETVGWFVQSGAIHRRTAFHLFSSKAFLYKEAAEAVINESRQQRAALFSELLKFYAICRVEDVRVDSIGWFLWERVSALKLTWKSSSARGSSTSKTLLRISTMLWRCTYASAFGTLHPKVEIAPSLSSDRLRQQLRDEASLRAPFGVKQGEQMAIRGA